MGMSNFGLSNIKVRNVLTVGYMLLLLEFGHYVDLY